ncbi:hypothetical protein H2201_002751 [Coniosporium apollinis]|uniref:BTB domain-containing protein n=1 Tax=Coniosporium apollinis TaxID=61459 RepID=A0ABQ9NXX0_9PEZI|nr:hypothetical protein H2201_002751 [Coniosporium apollinis]
MAPTKPAAHGASGKAKKGSRGGRGGGRGKRGRGARGGSTRVPQKRKRDGADDGMAMEGEGWNDAGAGEDYEGLVRLFDQPTSVPEEGSSIIDQHSKMSFKPLRYPDHSVAASFLLGPKQEETVWPTNLFARSTTINQALTTAPRDAVNLRVVDLSDVPVLHFRVYVAFLVDGELPTLVPLFRPRGPPVMKPFPYKPATVLELYKSACRLADPHFSDRVMDCFIELITTAHEYELDWADIIALYNSPARESAGRLLFVDLVAAAPGGLEEAEQKAEQLPSAFALQLARRVREIAGAPEGAAPWAGPLEGWCRYHEHTRVGGSCWREGLAEDQVAPTEVVSESHDAGEGAEANENVEEEVKDAEEGDKDSEEGVKDGEDGVGDAKQEEVEDAKPEENAESQEQETSQPDEEGPDVTVLVTIKLAVIAGPIDMVR